MKKKNIVRLLVRITTIALLIVMLLPTVYAGNKEPDFSLEGKSFKGSIKAKGLIGLFSVKGTLAFEDGLLLWIVEESKDSAPYDLKKVDSTIVFTARVPMQNDDYVDWKGVYDGESLSNVTAVWARFNEDDLIHDFFLPDVVTLVFKQK